MTSGSNVVSGLLSGVTLTLLGTTTGPVTVSTARDASGLADKVQALVDAANKLHQTIESLTAYDPDTKTAQALTGDLGARQLANSLAGALEDAVSGSGLVSPGLVGVSADKDGNFKFDRSKFLAAYNANPTGIAKMFTQGGSSANPDVTFISAADATRAGSYSVNVTHLATQATSIGMTGTWPTGVASSIAVKIGTTQISYAVKATDTQSDVVNGLNAAFANAGLRARSHRERHRHPGEHRRVRPHRAVRRRVGRDHVQLVRRHRRRRHDRRPGRDRQRATAPGAVHHAGVRRPRLNITGTTLGDLGTFNYTPGIAQRASTAVDDATDAVTGLHHAHAEQPQRPDQVAEQRHRRHGAPDRVVPRPAAEAVHEHGDRHQQAQGNRRPAHQRAHAAAVVQRQVIEI